MYTQISAYTNKHVNEKCHIWLLFVISSMKLYLSSFTHNSSRLSFRSLPICVPIPLILPCEKRPASDKLPLNCIKKSIAYMDWNIFFWTELLLFKPEKEKHHEILTEIHLPISRYISYIYPCQDLMAVVKQETFWNSILHVIFWFKFHLRTCVYSQWSDEQ